MDSAAHARELVAYNRWANQRVLDALASIGDADLTAPAAASKGSILDTLGHVVTAQALWLCRWKGEPASPPDCTTRDALASSMEAAQIALEAYVDNLDDGAWDRVVDYRNTAGQPFSVTFGRLFTHVINHATLHRGEAGFQLGLLGSSPGDLDYVLFVLEREAADR